MPAKGYSRPFIDNSQGSSNFFVRFICQKGIRKMSIVVNWTFLFLFEENEITRSKKVKVWFHIKVRILNL